MNETTHDLDETIGHLFRQHSGKMVAALCRSFGFERIGFVEDAVQDALIAAMKVWPYSGVPDNQLAWLLRTARNRCIDILRRDNRSTPLDSEPEFATDRSEADAVYFPSEIAEDQLRMIFACCHPEISPDSRVALTLKVVGGFSVGEIATAFLSNPEAVSKLLSRARSRLRELNVRMEMPPPRELPLRLDSVLKAIYLMFNEGYSASTGGSFIRKDLVLEAIRLASLLAKHPVTASPMVDAMTALFCFQAARMTTRSDHNGELLILAEQDRSSWDQQLIARGLHHFRRSAAGEYVSDYHLEAEIAAIYTLAADYASTDWSRILSAYEKLQSRKFSPVIELNLAIVIGQLRGPQAAYDRLVSIEHESGIRSYNLFYITKAHFESLLDLRSEARTSLERAASLTHNPPVEAFIQKRISELG